MSHLSLFGFSRGHSSGQAKERKARDQKVRTVGTGRRRSRGSLIHGIRTRGPLNFDECPRKYAALRQSFLDDWQPVSERERELVLRLVNTFWRLRRLWCIETTIAGASELPTYEAFREEHSPFPAGLRAADAVNALGIGGRTSLDLIHRYEQSLDGTFTRSIETLQVLRMARGEHALPSYPELPDHGRIVQRPAGQHVESRATRVKNAVSSWLHFLESLFTNQFVFVRGKHRRSHAAGAPRT